MRASKYGARSAQDERQAGVDEAQTDGKNEIA
jgi:hypothetical protein